eukprot:3543856-Alexandrium_andersonii.AAC.1
MPRRRSSKNSLASRAPFTPGWPNLKKARGDRRWRSAGGALVCGARPTSSNIVRSIGRETLR